MNTKKKWLEWLEENDLFLVKLRDKFNRCNIEGWRSTEELREPQEDHQDDQGADPPVSDVR
jgi:hypothetical protein